LKGGASSFLLLSVAKACHEAESILASDQLSQEEKKSSLAKVLVKIEEEFRNFKLEFEEFLKRIDQDQGPIREISEAKIIQFGERFLAFNPNIQYHFYFEFLFESISSCLESLNNPWAEVAGQLGKEVAPIEFKNPHFQIWPRPYEALFNTLIHAVRNAADHGIELPEERVRLGKTREGHLTIDVRSESQFFIIKIADDGAGIATDRLRLKLKERGVEKVDSLSDYEVNQCIFWPQLSLKEKVTEISGRGVGMDAIKEEAIKLGGRVWVNSTPHQGTELNIEVPFIQPGQFQKEKKVAS
jgi:two-component system chemotaxis sensor kinase CheA